jgi:hypothetical protein
VRKKRSVERIDFAADSPEGVVASMDRLAVAHSGWINLVPKVMSEQVETKLAFATLFGGGASGVTMCTWVPAGAGEPDRDAAELGITHTTGRRALGQLAELHLALLDGWVVAQDHPRRGLVLRVPPQSANEVVLSWALSAAAALSPDRRVGIWRAEIHLPLA